MSKKTMLLAAVAGMMVVNQTRADILLNVDITDMSAVIITATGALSAVDDATSDVFDGITLDNLFSSDFAVDDLQPLSGDLSGGSSGVPYNYAINDPNVPLTDLNIFYYDVGGVYEAQNFSTAAQAFTGSITFNFSGASIALGSSGNILVGESSSTVLGTWKAIPEPAAASLIMIAGGTGLVIRRRFTK